MNTAILPDGISYYIPNADLTFFKELAARMKWELVEKTKKKRRFLLLPHGLIALLENGKTIALPHRLLRIFMQQELLIQKFYHERLPVRYRYRCLPIPQ